MVRGWGCPHASDICPLTGVPLLHTIHIGSPLAGQGNPCVTHRAAAKGKVSGPNPGHKCPMNNPIPKLFRATMGQMRLESDTKKRAPATDRVPFVPSTDTKTSPPSGHIVPTVPPFLNPLQLSQQRGGSDGAVGLAAPHAGKIGPNPKGPPTKRPLAERRTPCLK